MASSDSDRDRPATKDQQANPFVAFRHFADAQMSSLVNSVFGIFESSPVRRQRAIEEYESMLRKSREMGPEMARSQSAINSAAEQAKEYSQHVSDTSPIGVDRSTEDDGRPRALLYGDDGDYTSENKRCPYRPTNSVGFGDPTPHMSLLDVSYIYTSPYSPVNLEQQDMFTEHSGKLRAAFADLLAFQQEEDLLSNNTVERNARMTPSDWLADVSGRLMFGRREMGHDLNRSDSFGVMRLARAANKLENKWAKPSEEESDHDEEDFCPGGDRPDLLGLMRLIGALSKIEDKWAKPPAEHLGHDEEDFYPGRDKSEFCELVRCVLSPWLFQSEEQMEIEHLDKESEESPSLRKGSNDEFGSDRHTVAFRQRRRDEHEEQQAREVNGDETPASEFDLYHALMEPQAESKVGSHNSQSKSAKFEEQGRNDNKPSILSTLTTSEQRTLPDGSVTTKVVLKKRFSDGVEEVTENVHTQNAPVPQKAVTAGSINNQTSALEKPKEEQRSGWFWT